MFESIFESLLTGLGTDLFQKTTKLIAELSPLFAAGFGIYIMIVALNAYNRGLDGNVLDLTKKVVGWLIIISCAFNATQYLKIANMLYEFPEQMASLITGAPYSANQLDANFNELLASMGRVEAYGQKEIPPLNVGDRLALKIMVLVILLCGIIFLTIVAAFYLVAKISLAMVILVGPIFIGSMLFPATRQWGMNWIGQIMSYSLMITFYIALGAIQQTFFESSLKNQITDDWVGLTTLLIIAAMYFTATMIFLVVTLSIPSIATALTGGATIGGFSGVMRSMVGLSKGASVGAGMPARGWNAAQRFYQRLQGNSVKPK